MTIADSHKEQAMNDHDDFKTIEQHIIRARQMRSAEMGAMIGNACAAAWHGLQSVSALWETRMAALKSHRATPRPLAASHR